MPHLQYRMKVELLSEAIFSSGEKEANLVQAKVLTDADGFVYFHAKSLKGLLKKRAVWLLRHYAKIDEKRAGEFLESIKTLFGINKEELKILSNEFSELVGSDSFIVKKINYMREKHHPAGILKLGHLQLPSAIRTYYKQLYVAQYKDAQSESGYVFMSKHNLLEAQTHIRTVIQLENSVVQKGMFSSMHTVRKGLLFYAELSLDQAANQSLIDDLERIVHALDRIGAAYHRGYGKVKTELLKI